MNFYYYTRLLILYQDDMLRFFQRFINILCFFTCRAKRIEAGRVVAEGDHRWSCRTAPLPTRPRAGV
jgi:hypothetical protein